MNRLKIFIYILFVIFIVANIMQELFLTRKMINSNLITAQILWTNNNRSCVVKTLEWSFIVPNCDQYRNGTFLEVFGSHEGESDKGFFQLKRLAVQSVKQMTFSRSSVKYWWSKAVVFIIDQKVALLKTGLKYLPPTHASLVAGMVFGGNASLPQELQQAFQVTGLTHVVSASGYNVSVVAGMTLWLLSKLLTKKFSTPIIIAVVWSYAIAAELVPPVVRSSIMISLNLIASRLFFRQYNLLFSLVLTALLMLLWEPFYLTSLSFWLSTLATLGIILFLPVLESEESWFSQLSIGHFSNQGPSKTESSFLGGIIKESFLVTLTAQILTLPLVSAVFGELSVLSFLTNTMLLWLTPLITLSGLWLMLLGALLSAWPNLWQSLAPVLSLGVWLPTELFMMGVKWFGQFEWGLVKLTLPWWLVWSWWVMLGLILLSIKQKKEKKKNQKYVTLFIN